MNRFQVRSLLHAALPMMLGFVVLVFSATSLAADAIYTGLFSNKAVGGYDTVAYFLEGKAVKGSAKHSVKYLNATWLFSSQENKALFISNPDYYSPQYGGYCAYAMAKGEFVSAQPTQWQIYEDKLYLNYNVNIKNIWSKDKLGYIKQANKQWALQALEKS